MSVSGTATTGARNTPTRHSRNQAPVMNLRARASPPANARKSLDTSIFLHIHGLPPVWVTRLRNPHHARDRMTPRCYHDGGRMRLSSLDRGPARGIFAPRSGGRVRQPWRHASAPRLHGGSTRQGRALAGRLRRPGPGPHPFFSRGASGGRPGPRDRHEGHARERGSHGRVGPSAPAPSIPALSEGTP